MIPSLEQLIFVGGLIHFATLLGSVQVPREMNFKEELPKLSPLLQHWIWTAGGYIVLNIVAFGILSTFLSNELASGSKLAKAICGYIAVFWAIRLVIQLFVFDAKPYLRNRFLTVGYHGLTIVFIYHTLVYGYAAFMISR